MTITERAVDNARSDAMQWAADARNRNDPPPSAEDMHREAARSLGSPGASTAAAILASTGRAPTPLDDDLKASAAPLATFEAVYRHYRARHHDGVGVELGEHSGVTLVAQRGTASAWMQWQAAVGVETHRKENGYGRTTLETNLLPLPRFVSLTWQPPVTPLRSTGVAIGHEAIVAAGRTLRPDAASGEAGWVLYAIAPVDGAPVIFRDRKADRFGVSVVATGVVPLFAVRPDGATLTASGIPLAEEMPTWLLAALGGRLGKRH